MAHYLKLIVYFLRIIKEIYSLTD